MDSVRERERERVREREREIFQIFITILISKERLHSITSVLHFDIKDSHQICGEREIEREKRKTSKKTSREREREREKRRVFH